MILEDIGFIKITGSKSRSFLQGLVTQYVNKNHSYSLMLNPQGRFLFDFYIHHLREEGLLLEVNKVFITDLLQKLSLYNLRGEVRIEATAEATHKMDRHKAFSNTESYHQARATEGILDGAYDLIQGNSLPIEYGFEALNAFDWEKGCFIGQEISRKMHHVETLKKTLMCIYFKDKIKDPQNLLIENSDGDSIGKITSNRYYKKDNKLFCFALIRKAMLNLHQDYWVSRIQVELI